LKQTHLGAARHHPNPFHVGGGISREQKETRFRRMVRFRRAEEFLAFGESDLQLSAVTLCFGLGGLIVLAARVTVEVFDEYDRLQVVQVDRNVLA
jgi:hypothetical protein